MYSGIRRTKAKTQGEKMNKLEKAFLLGYLTGATAVLISFIILRLVGTI